MIELTENLLYKLEEKMMQLLADAEGLRQQVQRLQQENNAYKLEKDNHARKLQDLVNLLDSVNPVEYSAPMAATAYASPVLVQA
jgi:regulator of replication initiation timing